MATDGDEHAKDRTELLHMLATADSSIAHAQSQLNKIDSLTDSKEVREELRQVLTEVIETAQYNHDFAIRLLKRFRGEDENEAID